MALLLLLISFVVVVLATPELAMSFCDGLDSRPDALVADFLFSFRSQNWNY